MSVGCFYQPCVIHWFPVPKYLNNRFPCLTWPCQTATTRGFASLLPPPVFFFFFQLCWQKGLVRLLTQWTVPLSQLAHLRYVLPAALPMCDGASRSEVTLQLLPASFNCKNLPQLNTPQSKASHLARQSKLTTESHARRGETCMQIWFGMVKGMVVKAGLKWVWSRWMNGFSQGGCICFSDSSQPRLTDTGKVTAKKNVQTGVMREQEEGLQGEDVWLQCSEEF